MTVFFSYIFWRREINERPLYHFKTWSYNGVWEKYVLISGKALFP
jgi:hypothetical protein